MASSFRTSKWDPLLIIAQIAAVQSLCYILYSIILYIALTLNGSDISLDLIFNDTEIRTDTGFGWSLVIVWVVNACLSIPILMYIVQRAKQILDFVATFHFIHLLLVWKVSHHFPTGLAWWILQIINIAIMTFGGEWACMHREMKPIMISSGNSRQNAGSSTSQSEPQEDQEELLGKNKKRKTSDVKEQQQDDQGALLAAVDKAKKAILSGSSSKSKRNGKQKYDQIPLKDMDAEEESSNNNN